ncbi:MAG: carbamoyl-phosphate synthase large subunit [Clostridia bacterium]|nr:carbamoyl-phosphate synthase large subunit [Clostridia bacterium]
MTNKYEKILVLGAGPVKIGQSLEFDYSALQVCRALKEEGIEVVFANSTPSALATDKTFADKVYIEPLNIESVKRILEKEKPDALLSTAGGDDSLELSLELAQNGYLEETNTVLIGINQDVIRSVKNRHSFTDALDEMNEPTVPALVVNSVDEACDFADKVGYPVIVRPAYTPDRESAEYCYSRETLAVKAEKSLETSIVSQILIEKSIAGWKELEFEVMRDAENNCISVSSVESIDPVGIHTGDSIVVIPAQTLTDSEFTKLRRAARKVVSRLGIEGSCNVQFALSPDGVTYFVTGVDPRVSRTSALVSKATGYRIAYVSAKIALGKTLFEIENDVTGCTTACSEPAMDYCAVKFPKWSFENFGEANRTLGTMMKATGESLTIGTGFELAFMKGVRSVNKTHLPRLEQFESVTDDELKTIINNMDDSRIFAVYEALYRGFSIDEINAITNIDKWFLNKLKNIADTEKLIKNDYSKESYEYAKTLGFTDFAIEQITEKDTTDSIDAVFNSIDTCSAEFDAQKPYFYSVYGADNEAEIFIKNKKSDKKKVLVVGSGPSVTGRSGDSDYCTVHCINSLKNQGFEVIVLNNNPASVTTDYNVADRVYLDPLSAEDILNVVRTEKPQYAVVLFGNEDAIKNAEILKNEGVEILGPDNDFFRKITNKIEFFDILDDANVKHTSSKKVCVGTCIEAHIISDGENYFVPALCEHVEKAHINSGDSISVFPTVSVSDSMLNTVEEYIDAIVKELKFKGALDVQFVVFDNDLYVTKASVTNTTLVPFVTKASGCDAVDLAVRCMAGEKLTVTGVNKSKGNYYVRVPVFSFETLKGADMLLGEKTKSTGDVMGIGDTFDNALLKGMIASGMRIKRTGSVLVSVCESDKSEAASMAEEFLSQGFKIYATSDTAKILNSNHIATNTASGELAVEMINANKFSYVVSTLQNNKKDDEDAVIRRAALMRKTPVFTSVHSAYTFSKSLANNNVMEELEVTDI